MDLNSILSGKGIVVKNPEYTGKRDKKHPPTITIPETIQNREGIYSDFNRAADEKGWLFPNIDDTKKYYDKGISINRFNFNNLDKELYEHQSNFETLLNGLAQTANEVVLGSAAATAELPSAVPVALAQFTDFLLGKVFGAYDGNKIQNALGLDGGDYGNIVSDTINKWKEDIDKAVPIYEDPDVDIAHGGFSHLSWYMKNFPSLASSLTLLLPTKLASVGVGKALKGIRALSNSKKLNKILKEAENIQTFEAAGNVIEGADKTIKLNRLQRAIHSPINQARLKQAGSITGEALIMRTLENYQEAHQTYTDLYKQSLEQFDKMSAADYNDLVDKNKEGLDRDGVDKNDKDAVAKWIAKQGADRTFAMDYANTIFDIVQLAGLKNIGLLSKELKSPRLSRLHQESIRTAGMSAEKAAEQQLAKSTRQKIWELAKDNAKGAWPKFWKESTEGIEEAINYMASEEGLTYGNVLLGNEKDASLSGFFNKRLMQYMSNPELWESAFWGWLGGLTFGVAGTGVEHYQAYRKEKAKRKEERERLRKFKEAAGIEINEEEEEAQAKRDDWVEMSELSTIKGAAAAIRKRNVRMSTLAQNLKHVDEGRNPLDTDDNGTMREFDAANKEQQQALVKAKLIHQFRRELAKDAINSGTYDSLTDYLAAEPVRQALVEMGAVSEAESREFIDQTLKDLNETREIMSRNLSDANYKIAALNKEAGPNNQIPLEYVQHIANENTDMELNILDINEQLSILEKQVAKAEQDGGIEDTLGDSATVRQMMKINQLAYTFAQLEAKRKEIEADSEITEWRRAQDLDHIKEQKETVLKTLRNVYQVGDNEVTRNVNVMGALLHTIRQSKAFEYVNGQLVTDVNNPDFAKSDEEIMQEFEDMFGKNRSQDETDAIIQANKILAANYDKLHGKHDINGNLIVEGFRNKNTKAYDIHAQIADLELLRDTYQGMIARSQKQIIDAVDNLHNTFSHVRQEVLVKAESTIREIHSKYLNTNQADVEQAIVQAYFGNREQANEIAKRILTGTDAEGKSDATKFMTALNMLALSQGASRGAFKYVMKVLEMNAERIKASRQNTSTFQNPSQSNQGAPTNNPSQAAQQLNQGAGNGQNNNPQQQNQPQQAQQTTRYIAIRIDNTTGDITSISVNKTNRGKGINIKSTADANGNFVIDIASMDDSVVDKKILMNSDELFNMPNGIATLSPALTIQSNPIVSPTGQVIQKGVIVASTSPVGNGNAGQGQPQQPQGAPAAAPAAAPTQPTVQGPAQPPAAQPAMPPQAQQPAGTNGPILTQGPNGETLVQMNPSTGEVAGFDDIRNPSEEDEDKMVHVNELVLLKVSPFFGDAAAFAAENKDELIQDLINDVKSSADAAGVSYEDDAEIERLVKRHVQFYAASIATMDSNIKDGRALAASVIKLAMYSKAENKSNPSYGTIITNSIREVLENYIRCQIIPKANVTENGVTTQKYVVDPTDILNLLNSLYDNNQRDIIEATFKALQYYFTKTTEGKNNYYLTEPMTDNMLLAVGRSAETIESVQVTKTVQRERVNLDVTFEFIADHYGDADNNGVKARLLQQALDSISTGSMLRIQRGPKGGIDFYVDVNGQDVHIGYMPEPEKTPGGYAMINQHWLTEIKLDSRGEPVSDLYTLFTKWFTGNDNVDKLIQQLMVDAYIATIQGNYNNFKAAASAQFVTNRDIVAATQGLIVPDKSTGKIDYGVVFDHLFNLWRYTVLTAQQSRIQGRRKDIKDQLRQWFKNRYITYDRVANFNPNKNQIQVDYINEGNVIHVVSNHAYQHYDELPLAKEGLANPEQCGIGHITNKGKDIIVSNHDGSASVLPNPMPQNQGVVVVLNSRNTTPDTVHCVPVRMSDKTAMKAVMSSSNLGKAVSNYSIYTIDKLKELVSRGDEGNIKDTIFAFMTSFISTSSSSSDRIPLFRNLDSDKYVIVLRENTRSDGTVVGYQFQVLDKNNNGNVLAYFSFNWRLYTPSGNDSLFINMSFTDANTSSGHGFLNMNDGDVAMHRFADKIVSVLGDYLQTNLSYSAIDSETTKPDINKGFIKRKNGKIIIAPPAINGNPVTPVEYDSYGQMIIENNMVRVNTQIGPNGKNHTPKPRATDPSQKGNQVLYVNLAEVQDDVPIADDLQFETNQTDTIVSQKQDLKTAIDQYAATVRINAAVNAEDKRAAKYKFYEELFKAANRTNVFETLMRLTEEYQLEVDLLPDDIDYDKGLNWYNRNTNTDNGPIAATSFDEKYVHDYDKGRRVTRRVRKGEVLVGNKFLNMMASKDVRRRNTAIKTLFHEKLHGILANPAYGDREAWLADIRDIYNLFEQTFDAMYDETNPNHTYIKSIVDRYRNSDENRKLEEFLVEAITDRSFYDFLNSIELQEEVATTEKKTLLDKIVDLIRRLFNWKPITKNSLYHKLYETLKTYDNVKYNSVFNTPTSDEVEIRDMPKRRKDTGELQPSRRIYLKGQISRGYFEVVKDTETDNYSVHFKPTDKNNPNAFSKAEKVILFQALADAIPEGKNVSTWGELSEGGAAGVKRFANLGFTETDTRTVKNRKGEDITIPVYTKDITGAQPESAQASTEPSTPESTAAEPATVEQTTPPVEEMNESQQPAEHKEQQGFSIGDDDFDLDFNATDDNDTGGFRFSVEENMTDVVNQVTLPASINPEGNKVTSIDVIKEQLPTSCQSSFDDLVKSGFVSVTCN